MTVEMVIDLAQQALMTALMVALPVLGAGMTVGLVIAIFQAATQIQEASLNFVPKLIAMGVALIVAGGWMIEKLAAFTVTMFNSMSTIGGGG